MHYLVVTLQIVSICSWQRKYNDSSRPVASGGGPGGRTVNPVSTMRADYAHHSTKCPPEFSDLTTALGSI